MITPDMINEGFELVVGILLWWNVRLIVRDKKLRGVSILPTSVFGLWGLWNLYYYPYLEQMLSFVRGIFVVVANTTWIFLALYYMIKEKKKGGVRE